MQISGIILAGGKSSRMGENKALLPFGNELIIERVVAKVKSVVDGNDIMIIVGAMHASPLPQEYMKLNIPIVSDLFLNKGPLGGVYTGLTASKSEYNLFVGCDMPFLNVSFLEYMISQSEGYELTIPKFGSKYQPLCAVYSKNCIPKIKGMIEQNRLKLDSLVFEVETKLIEEREVRNFNPDGTMFFNVNTKFEYQKALEIAAQERTKFF